MPRISSRRSILIEIAMLQLDTADRLFGNDQASGPFSRRNVHGQSLGADHRPRVVELRWFVTCYRDFPVPLEEDPEHDLGLQSRQRSSETEMDAVPKGEVRIGRTTDVEPVGF